MVSGGYSDIDGRPSLQPAQRTWYLMGVGLGAMGSFTLLPQLLRLLVLQLESCLSFVPLDFIQLVWLRLLLLLIEVNGITSCVYFIFLSKTVEYFFLSDEASSKGKQIDWLTDWLIGWSYCIWVRSRSHSGIASQSQYPPTTSPYNRLAGLF